MYLDILCERAGDLRPTPLKYFNLDCVFPSCGRVRADWDRQVFCHLKFCAQNRGLKYQSSHSVLLLPGRDWRSWMSEPVVWVTDCKCFLLAGKLHLCQYSHYREGQPGGGGGWRLNRTNCKSKREDEVKCYEIQYWKCEQTSPAAILVASYSH